MGSAKPLHLFVIVLAFVCLASFQSNALPSTSAEGEVILQETTPGLSSSAPSMVPMKNDLIKTKKLRIGRIEYELFDYPGSGANDRHSP